ncbi:MAG: hypothetical protein WBE68_16410 [Candidatus Nitrosopolaris sp.]
MIRKEVKFLELKTFFFLLALLLLSIMVITISTNSLISYDKYSNNDKYSYYHKAYAAANGTKSFNVMIPKGSANPQIDITKLGPRQWYLPRQITVSVNDKVTWTNNDTEAHTVTSGNGAGIE